MRFLSIILIFVITSCVSVKEVVHYQDRDHHIKYFPPGTVWVKDSLFMDQAEMTNYGYFQFVEDIAVRKGEGSAMALFLDTSTWLNLENFYSRYHSESKPYAAYYHKLTRFWDYPVVGVDHKMAKAYCKWRSQYVNRGIHAYIMGVNEEQKQQMDLDTIPFYVEFRLPEKEEW